MVDFLRGIVAEAFDFGLVLAKNGYSGRDVRRFGQGVIRPVGVASVGKQFAQGQVIGPEAVLQAGEQPGQVPAVAAIG